MIEAHREIHAIYAMKVKAAWVLGRMMSGVKREKEADCKKCVDYCRNTTPRDSTDFWVCSIHHFRLTGAWPRMYACLLRCSLDLCTAVCLLREDIRLNESQLPGCIRRYNGGGMVSQLLLHYQHWKYWNPLCSVRE